MKHIKVFVAGFKRAWKHYFEPLRWLRKKLTVTKFLKLDDAIVERNQIAHIDTLLIEQLNVLVYMKDGACYNATNLNAIELLMQVYPASLEGFRFRYYKFVWVIHNLFGHPLMQLFALFKMYRVAFWIHNVTVPCPTGKKDERKGRQ